MDRSYRLRDDMVAGKLGMKVFLLTDHLINKADVDISVFPHGGFAQLQAYIDRLIAEKKGKFRFPIYKPQLLR